MTVQTELKNSLEALSSCSLVKRQPLVDSAAELGATKEQLLEAIKYRWYVAPQSFYTNDTSSYYASIEACVSRLVALN